MRFGSLFSGIGGLDLGLEWAGHECRWQVESDEYCSRVLAKHWPNVTRYGDINEVDFELCEPVELLAGGFPCQDLSYAGKGLGLSGPRSGLWSEFKRAVRVARPRYVLVENVPGLLSRGMGAVLGDLAALGYDAEWQRVSAASVGAPHLRERIFILAHAERSRWLGPGGSVGEHHAQGRPGQTETYDDGLSGEAGGEPRVLDHADASGRGAGEHDVYGRQPDPAWRGDEVADTDVQRCERRALPNQRGQAVRDSAGGGESISDAKCYGLEEPWFFRIPPGQTSAVTDHRGWEVEPALDRVVDGFPGRVEQLRGLGNAVVPQVAQYLGELLAEHERSVA